MRDLRGDVSRSVAPDGAPRSRRQREPVGFPAFPRRPVDLDDPADERDQPDEQKPAALVDVVQAAHAGGQRRQQDGQQLNPETVSLIMPQPSETRKLKRKNHQYSERDALPSKVAYFEKQVRIDSPKVILLVSYPGLSGKTVGHSFDLSTRIARKPRRQCSQEVRDGRPNSGIIASTTRHIKARTAHRAAALR